MTTSVQLRPSNRDLGMVMREVDENLAIFLGIRNEEKERSPEPRLDNLSIPIGLGETGKSDSDWLLDVDEQTAAAGISVEASLPAKVSEESAPLADATSITLNKRPASSGGRKPASRSPTPTLPAKTQPSRASTHTSRASSKPMTEPGRSSTLSRSSTPCSKTAIPATLKPASRSAKPTRKPATLSTTSTVSASSGRKTVSVSIKNPVSKTLKSRPPVMLSLAQNAPQNVKASLPRRPSSASRGRPSLSSSSKGKPRQKSCSPTKLRAAQIRPLYRSRGYSHGGGGDDDVNPVLMGTQMVERVVNMRKLAPPKQEHTSLENTKKSSHDSSGFGRSLSNRSLDMAIRHMDIRRSISGNLRPVATSGGNQSSSSQSSSFGVSESPITSSSDSSKSSNCVNSYFLDGRQMDD